MILPFGFASVISNPAANNKAWIDMRPQAAEPRVRGIKLYLQRIHSSLSWDTYYFILNHNGNYINRTTVGSDSLFNYSTPMGICFHPSSLGPMESTLLVPQHTYNLLFIVLCQILVFLMYLETRLYRRSETVRVYKVPTNSMQNPRQISLVSPDEPDRN